MGVLVYFLTVLFGIYLIRDLMNAIIDDNYNKLTHKTINRAEFANSFFEQEFVNIMLAFIVISIPVINTIVVFIALVIVFLNKATIGGKVRDSIYTFFKTFLLKKDK